MKIIVLYYLALSTMGTIIACAICSGNRIKNRKGLTMKLDPTTRVIIKADGSEIALDGKKTTTEISKLIGAERHGLDTVRLTNGLVMLVDDIGCLIPLPINKKASELYQSRLRPGYTGQIFGDVAIVPDADFA